MPSSRPGPIKEDLDPEVGAAIRSRILIAQLLYAIGLALCVFHTGLQHRLPRDRPARLRLRGRPPVALGAAWARAANPPDPAR